MGASRYPLFLPIVSRIFTPDISLIDDEPLMPIPGKRPTPSLTVF